MDPRLTSPHPAPDLPGYRDVTLISSGSTSLVYRAVQTRLSRTVAIKVLLVDGDATTREQYQRELETTVLLSSQPHIVGIIDTGTTATGHPYIVMEYCPGGSYGQILEQRGPLPVDEVVEVGAKVAEALQAAHDVGVLHRDVKPSNILRSAFGPALADFGIARAPHQLEGTNALDWMTPHHASPEAMRKDRQSPVSDLYSLASTLWHLLAGRPPFADPARPLRDLNDLRNRVLTEPAPPVPRADVPEWLQRELARALAKDPGARHPSAHTFAEILRYHAHSVPQSTFPATPPPPTMPAPPPPIAPAVQAPVTASRDAFRWPQSAPTRRSEYLTEPEPVPESLPPDVAAASTITWSGEPVAQPSVAQSPVEPEPEPEPYVPSTVDEPEDSPRPTALDAPTELHPLVSAPPAPPMPQPAFTTPPPLPPTFTQSPPLTQAPPFTQSPAYTQAPNFTAPPTLTPQQPSPAPRQPAYSTPPIERFTPRIEEESWSRSERPRRSGNALAIVSASIAAVLVIAVVIVALVTRQGHGEGPSAGPVASGTQTLKVVSQGAPTGVRLQDDGTSVTLTWTDPNNTVPIAVLGGQANAAFGVLILLDAGATTWTQEGLNQAYEYCYIVAAFYTADGDNVAARSPQVCTHRHG